jgi:hypothetical protein
MRFVEDKVALGQVFIPELQFFRVNIILLMLHTGIHLHSTLHHDKWVNLANFKQNNAHSDTGDH